MLFEGQQKSIAGATVLLWMQSNGSSGRRSVLLAIRRWMFGLYSIAADLW